MKHSGMLGRKVNTGIWAIDRNFFDSADSEYFYPTEYINDPYNTGKKYTAT